MEEKLNSLETLFERVVAYSNTTIALLKLKAVDKSSEMFSSLVPRLCILSMLLMFVLVLNIGIALWLGEMIGKSYFGFFIVAAFYFLLAFVLLLMQPWIKKRLIDSIITNTLK